MTERVNRETGTDMLPPGPPPVDPEPDEADAWVTLADAWDDALTAPLPKIGHAFQDDGRTRRCAKCGEWRTAHQEDEA